MRWYKQTNFIYLINEKQNDLQAIGAVEINLPDEVDTGERSFPQINAAYNSNTLLVFCERGGKHSTRFYSGDLPTGLFTYQFRGGSTNSTKRMMIVQEVFREMLNPSVSTRFILLTGFVFIRSPGKTTTG